VKGSPVNIPPHVPLGLVVDFDFYHPKGFVDDAHKALYALKLNAPGSIFWTPRNGGHWVVVSASGIKAVQNDFSHFSHSEIILPPAPDSDMRLLPAYLDPPAHRSFRSLVMPPLLPTALGRIEAGLRRLTIELTEKIAPLGQCEFIAEFASVMPVVVFCELFGLPQEDRERILPWGSLVTRGGTLEIRQQAMRDLDQYVLDIIRARELEPRGDLISTLVAAKIDGRKITERETLEICRGLVLGGLDTVAGMLGFFARFLALNPIHCHQLIDDPRLIPNAVEELIRRHGIVNSARRVARDVCLEGVELRAGDMIQVPNLFYGLDETVSNDPLTVDFNRPRPRHVAFGSGPHICPAQHLARRELTVFIEEWLKRIPNFAIAPNTHAEIESGMVLSVRSLHLVWIPRGSARNH